MRNKWPILLTLAVMFFACQSDKKERYYFFDKYESMDVGDGKETFIHKSKKMGGFDTIIVHSDIVKFKENNSYIIALQKPNKKLMLDRIESILEILYKYNSENDSVVISFPHIHTTIEINSQYRENLDSLLQTTKDSVKTYQIEAKKIFENECFYQKIYKNPLNYYIIDKKEDSVFGNLNRDEFIKLKQAKGIKLEF